MKSIFVLVSFLVSSSLFAADAAQPDVFAGFGVMLQQYAPHLIGMFIGVLIMLRGIADGLTKISVYTDNTWDNKIAAQLSQIAWIMGSILGKFGYSVPTEVAKDKVDTALVKAGVKPDGK